MHKWIDAGLLHTAYKRLLRLYRRRRRPRYCCVDSARRRGIGIRAFVYHVNGAIGHVVRYSRLLVDQNSRKPAGTHSVDVLGPIVDENDALL